LDELLVSDKMNIRIWWADNFVKASITSFVVTVKGYLEKTSLKNIG